MMDQSAQFQEGEKKEAPADSNEEKPAETKPDAGTTETDAQNKTPMKKVKSKKDLKNDPSRFELPGVNFNAKLIGIDDVESARGDKMCQESMHKLKIAVKTAGQHKQKIIVNVSLDGIRIIDLRTQTTHHSHPVHRISFISRDLTDGRAFGYVFGAGEGKHKFYAIKTEKAAEALVLTLRDLFQVVYDLKKKEMEEAKSKVEEKKEESKEEPVYQIPNKAVPVENGSVPGTDESTYEVPPNNAPVRNTSSNLLMLETEMEAIEKRIEQIDTMDELFKELEAPPVTTATPSSSSSGSSWSSDLAGLSTAPPTQPTFSIGGGAFPGAQPWGQQPGFPQQNQPFGAPLQPGNPMMANVPFGGQPAQPNPFGAPGVPPRPGVGFPSQQTGGFPGQQPPAKGFPGTPFPAFQNQQPGFPTQPQPTINVQAPNDPFGSDPFQIGDQGFEENILTPAKLEAGAETPAEQPKKKDAFDDLVVDIGSKTERAKSPKDMFTELSAAPKTSLNELKAGNRTPSPKPQSPFGNQASQESQTSIISNVTTSSLPLTAGDPFANDPFASNINTNAALSFDIKSAPLNEHIAHAFSNDSVIKPEVFSDDDFNLPSPDGPPPPLPDSIMNQNIKSESLKGPEPPPRPLYNTHHTPPLPPRPGSAISDTAKNRTNSMIESQPMKQQQYTPPLPPRPQTAYNSVAVPRPKPRSSTNKDLDVKTVTRDKNSLSEVDKSKNKVMDYNANTKLVNNNSGISSDIKMPERRWTSSISSPKIADPFVSTDPFALEDPFNESDPFTHDPFASDPFSDPMFTNNTQPFNSSDPFTSVVSSPKPTLEDSDPFSVFDKTVSSDAFKFDKNAAKKVKLKGAVK